MGLLDQPEFPLDEPDGTELRDRLAALFSTAKAESFCRETGLRVEDLPFEADRMTRVKLWEEILFHAARVQKLRRLVEVIAENRESATIRDFLLRLLAEPREDEPATVILTRISEPTPGTPSTPPEVRLGQRPADDRRARSALVRRLTGHHGRVSGLAFSPDGSLLASAGEDGQLLLWDLATGTRPRPLAWSGGPPHTGPVHSVTFNRDGSLLASGGLDHKILLWDVRTAQRTLTLTGHSGAVHSVAFGTGPLLASGGADQTVRLWDVRAGRPRQVVGRHDDAVSRVAFSADHTLLASGGADRTVRLWAMPGGGSRHILNGHSTRISGIAFSSDGTLASTDWDEKSLRLWNSAIGQFIDTLPCQGEGLLDVAFAPSGALLAVGTRDGSVRLRQLLAPGSGRWLDPLISRWLDPLIGHDGPATCVAFSRDGTLLASGGADHVVRVWWLGGLAS